MAPDADRRTTLEELASGAVIVAGLAIAVVIDAVRWAWRRRRRR